MALLLVATLLAGCATVEQKVEDGIDSIKESVVDTVTAAPRQWLGDLAESIRQFLLDITVSGLGELIVRTPDVVTGNEPLMKAYNTLASMARGAMLLLVVLLGWRRMVGYDDTQWWQLLQRGFIANIFMSSTVTLFLFRTMIQLNNALIKALLEGTVKTIAVERMVSPVSGTITMLIFTVIFIALMLRLFIEYLIRLLEILYCIVSAPIAWFLYIMPTTAHITQTWLSNSISLVFTQFFLAVRLVVFSLLTAGLAGSSTGIVDWLFQTMLGIAGLVFVLKTPAWMAQMTYNSNVSLIGLSRELYQVATLRKLKG